MPFWKRLLMVSPQRGIGAALVRHWRGMAWHVWISIGRPETACVRPAHLQFLPATSGVPRKLSKAYQSVKLQD
jgi:hypothetical protein